MIYDMNTVDAALLFQASLRPKDFPELGFSAQQLRAWTDMTGYQPAEREGGKWRLFPPADVFRLAVLRELKARTGLAVTDHPTLVATVGADDFVRSAITLWAAAKVPCLVTDLRTDHHILAAAEVDVAALVRGEGLCCAMALTPAIQLMRLAVVRGGTKPQQLQCHALEVLREAADRRASVAVADASPQVAPMKRAHPKGGRQLDLDAGDA